METRFGTSASGRPRQLRRAAGHRRRLARSLRVALPLIHASAEQIPLADAAFDLVVSEYGASIWCDLDAWIPEAARVLRPGGQLIFLASSVHIVLTWPDQDERLGNRNAAAALLRHARFQWLAVTRWSSTLAMAT